jgi:hypothetical protein
MSAWCSSIGRPASVHALKPPSRLATSSYPESSRRAASAPRVPDLQAQMAAEIARLFPGCPPDRGLAIARHAAVRGSGRVGRSAAGRALQPNAIELAVAASVRHRETRYDELLMSGLERGHARTEVRADVARVLDAWRQR